MRFVIIGDSEIIQIFFEPVLRRQAGIGQIAALGWPFMKPSVVKHFQCIIYDKRYKVIAQTFLK